MKEWIIRNIEFTRARIIVFFRHKRIKWVRFKKKMPRISVWFKKNWPGLTLELVIILSSAFLGFLIGLFIGIVMVINGLGA